MFWITVPLTLLAVILQITLAPSLRVLGVHADLAVVWLGCYAAARNSSSDTLPLILTAGVALGLSGAEPFGASLFALLPLAALLLAKDVVPVPGRFFVALLFVAVGALFYALLQPPAAALGGQSLGPPLNVLRIAPRSAIVDTLTAAVWFWPIRLVFAPRVALGSFRRVT
jgi:hypothetical protein